MKRLFPYVLLALALLVAGAVGPGPESEPMAALSSLNPGEHLIVKRSVTRLEVGAPGSTEALLSVNSDGVATLRTGVERPAPSAAANVREARDASGAIVWHVAHTARGAQMLVAEPGVLHPKGLEVLVFDNDDLHVATGDGDVLLARRTLADGTLIEEEGPDGCSCRRTTSPEGRVTVEGR